MNNTETCPNCGEVNAPGSAFCDNCGKLLGPAPILPPLENLSTETTATPTPAQKSPILAAILSLLIAGLGEIYVGKWLRGAAIFLVAVIAALWLGWPLWVLFIGISAADAYYQAQKV